MKKVYVTLVLIFSLGFLSACGDYVEIPPAHVGKLSTASGLSEGIIQPGQEWLSSFCWVCDKLIILEAGDFPIEEPLEVFMPSGNDRLNLKVDIRGVITIGTDPTNLNRVFSKIPAVPVSDRVSSIPMTKIYNTYGRQVLRSIARDVIREHSINEVLSNSALISNKVEKAVRDELKSTPMSLNRLGLADIQPPPVVVAAEETRKKREVDILKAEADKQIKLKEAEARLAVAVKEQEVDLKEAETTVLVNKKLSEGMNKAIITRKALDILMELAKSDNKVFFMPHEAMSNPVMILGAMNETSSAGNQ